MNIHATGPLLHACMLSAPALLMERSFLQPADGSPSGKYPKLRVTAIKLLSGTNRKLRESPLEPLRGLDANISV